MSITATIAICLQISAILLLRHRLGHRWYVRPFSVLTLAAILYHGVTEVLLSFSVLRQSNTGRQVVSQEAISDGALVVSAATLFLVFGYLASGPRAVRAPTSDERRHVAQILDWRLAAFAAIPLLLITAQGRGYATGEAYVAAESELTVGIAQLFLLPTVVLASLGYLLRHGIERLIPVLVIQTLALTMIGQRLEIFVSALALAVLISRSGLRARRRQVIILALMTGVIALAVTGARSDSGRDLYYTDTGVGARLSAVLGAIPSGVGLSSDEGDGPSIIAQAAERFDSNVYVGAIHQKFDEGASPLGWGVVGRSLGQPVPSILYPTKLTRPIWERDPEFGAIHDLGIADVDYLPGFVGSNYSAVGWWLLAVMLVAGLAFGMLEQWAFNRFTPSRLVVIAGITIGAAFYERGFAGFLIQVRFILPVCLAVLALELIRKVTAAKSRKWNISQGVRP